MDIFVSARTFDEYVRMFGLSLDDLDGKILDCAGGAASFTAELSEQGGAAYSVDPLYKQPIDGVERAVWSGVGRARDSISSDLCAYDWSYMENPERHFLMRSTAAKRFLAHRRKTPSCYVPAELPHLPFRDRSFDVVLCSHLLFTYASKIDLRFHITAIGEMLRVCREEVRIYPLVGAELDASQVLDGVLRHLDGSSIKARVEDVRYRFQVGAGEMLRLASPRATTPPIP